jgi:hypothetical protein
LHGDCVVRDTFGLSDEQVRSRRTAHGVAEPFIVQTWEKLMKLVKTSAIAFAMSAMLVGPVLAQGASSDTQIRGGAQGKSTMHGGTLGSGDEDFGASPGTPGAKAGVNAKAGAKGTVGAGGGSPKGTTGGAVDPASGGKRY